MIENLLLEISNIISNKYFFIGIVGIFCLLFIFLVDVIFIPTAIFSIGSLIFYLFYLFYVSIALDQFYIALSLLLILLLSSFLLFFIVIYFRLYKVMVFDKTLPAISNEKDCLIGKCGKSISHLRPSGKVEIEGEIFDAISQGEFIFEGSYIRVFEISGAQLGVRMDQK